VELTILNSYVICHPVTAYYTTESFVWFWFKFFWKCVQGSLIFNPSQVENQTHKPAKWHALKTNMFSIGQLQDYPYGVIHVQWKHKWWATKFQCTRCKNCLHRPIFCSWLHRGKFPNHTSFTIWEETCFKKCKFCVFDYNNILFYFRNLWTFLEKTNFSS